MIRFKISKSLRQDLHEHCRAQGATLFMGLLAAWFALLHRYSGQSDLCIGTPVSNRDRLETENLIGLFVNTLVLRLKLDDEPAFSEVLERVKQAMLDARAHQDLPFEAVVDCVEVPRSLAHSPLFQVFFNFHNASGTTLEMNGLQLEALEPASESALFDVSLDLIEEHGEIHAALEYNTDLYEPQTAARWTEHYLSLLGGALAEPGRRIGELELLSNEEYRILTAYAEPVNDPETSWMSAFQKQVDATPEATALACCGKTLSYRELNRRARLLARSLGDFGAGPERTVAVYCERDLEWIVALIGILQYGAAYLPLDPHQPAERNARILRQAGAAVILCTEERHPSLEIVLENLPPVACCAVATIESLAACGQTPVTDSIAFHPMQTAYRIYTSGSTGTPKGVTLHHAGMLNHIRSKIERLDLGAEDRIAQSAAQTFDVSIWQALAGLLCGARIEILPHALTRNAEALFEALREREISVFQAVPSTLTALLDAAPADAELPHLRWLVTAGEALPAAPARAWLKRFPDSRVLNYYGPTEASDGVSQYEIPRSFDAAGRGVPIGTAIEGVKLYVLDSYLQPVPPGVVGQLYIGGCAVGRGYHDDARRTARVFVPDPFTRDPGLRMYASGDRARWLADGTLEFSGRCDQQIKLRGFRIEPGEIQARLEEHPNVSRALVTTHTDSEGESRLIAYVTGGSEAGDESDLGHHLRNNLPDYMIPVAFVHLPAFPLNANGKIDRAALPKPQPRAAVAEAGQDLRTPLETLLAQLWAEVLDLPRVGREQDFFELGGHSLLAVRLVQQIRHSVHPDCPLSAVFHAPSVARMAEWLQHGQDTRISPLVLLNAGGSSVPLFCVHPAGGHVLEYRPLADFFEGRRPVYGLQARSLGDPQANPDSIETLAEDYVQVLLDTGHDGPFYLLGWSLGGSIALAIAARLESAGREVAFLGLLDTWRQMDTNEPEEWIRHFADFLSDEDRVRLEGMDADERKSLDRCVNRPGLSPIERLEGAVRFGQSRGYWLKDVAMELIRVQYLEERQSTVLIRAFTPTPIKAPLSLWWAEASLDGRGRTPGNWNDVALGGCRTRVIETDHKTIVRHPRVHAEIAEALREVAATGGKAQP